MEKSKNTLRQVVDEVTAVIENISERDFSPVIEMIKTANRIFVTGRGRSGLMMKALAMRLMHLGFTSYVVGETTAPAIGERDLLIVGCGSGRTPTISVEMESAFRTGARVVLITAAKNAVISKYAGEVIILPIPVQTVQPLGTLFEQSLLLFSDVLVMKIMQELMINPDIMRNRHTNLE